MNTYNEDPYKQQQPYSLNIGQTQNTQHQYNNQQNHSQSSSLEFYYADQDYNYNSNNFNNTNPAYNQFTPNNNDTQLFLKSTSIWSAFGSCGFPSEPSLLEELGINFNYIKSKLLLVLNPFSNLNANSNALNDPDLSGPFIIILALGITMLLNAKYQFGYIYGIGLIGCLGIYLILNFMCTNGTTGYNTASVLGYCMLPMTLISLINSLIVVALAVLWCTYSASTIFVKTLNMQDQKLLVAYPILLLYTCFALLIIY